MIEKEISGEHTGMNIKLWKIVREAGFGRPSQSVEVGGEVRLLYGLD